MTKINRSKLDTVQLEYLAKAEALQKELMSEGFLATRIEKGEDHTDFTVIFFDGTRDYTIKRGWDGNVYVHRTEYKRHEYVSSSTRGEVYKKHRGNNVKVITHNKVQGLIDAENATLDELDALNFSAIEKKSAFIATVEASGLPVKWTKDSQNPNKITGGEIERGGLEFSFHFHEDGYISQKTTIRYTVENSLEAFMALSANEYKKN